MDMAWELLATESNKSKNLLPWECKGSPNQLSQEGVAVEGWVSHSRAFSAPLELTLGIMRRAGRLSSLDVTQTSRAFKIPDTWRGGEWKRWLFHHFYYLTVQDIGGTSASYGCSNIYIYGKGLV